MTYPVFASGDVLNASDMNAVGLWLVKTQTIGSAVSSVAVTSCFSSDYENYKITINGGVASGNPNLGLQMGSSTSGYYGGNFGAAYSNGAYSGRGLDNAASFLYAGFGTTQNLVLDCDLLSPNLAKWTTLIGHTSRNDSTSAFGGMLANHESAVAYTGFTITVSTGTITGGTIRVYGYRN